MTPMMVSWFCPKDCDRPKSAAQLPVTEDGRPHRAWAVIGFRPISGSWIRLDGCYLYPTEAAMNGVVFTPGRHYLVEVSGIDITALGSDRFAPKNARVGSANLRGRVESWRAL